MCKDEVIYQMGSTSIKADSPLAYTRDEGATDAAVAKCKPFEKIMTTCQEANMPARKSYCATGSDKDIPHIRLELNNMKADLKAAQAQRNEIKAKYEEIYEDIEFYQEQIDVDRAIYEDDMQLAKENEDFIPVFKSKWIGSGRRDAMNAVIRENNARKREYQALVDESQAIYDANEALQDRYKHIAKVLMDENQDCAAAMEVLR